MSYGAHFPFTGCISGLRMPIERYREHVRKAKALRNHFCGQQFRRIRGLLGIGKLPSLSRLLAREGPQAVSILPVETLPVDIHGGVARAMVGQDASPHSE